MTFKGARDEDGEKTVGLPKTLQAMKKEHRGLGERPDMKAAGGCRTTAKNGSICNIDKKKIEV